MNNHNAVPVGRAVHRKTNGSSAARPTGTFAATPVVYDQGQRVELSDADYRKFLLAKRFLSPMVAETLTPVRFHHGPCLHMDWQGRRAAEEHAVEGFGGSVDMAIPEDQVPPYVLRYWGYDVADA